MAKFETGTKVCTICLQTMPLSEFRLRMSRSQGYINGPYHYAYCKPCQRKYHRDWYLSNKHTYAHYVRKRKYGLTKEEFEELFAKQEGVCAICGEVPTSRALAVDHDHATGAVRGLLCRKCNLGLGFFKDNISLLTKAIHYIGAV